MEIKTIIVLVEIQDGTVHQVLAPAIQRDLALRCLADEKDGAVKISDEPYPMFIKHG